MKQEKCRPDYIFTASWEVCNKIGGIYTVLSTQAKSIQQLAAKKIIYIGPDVNDKNSLFEEDTTLYGDWKTAAVNDSGLKVRTGYWKIPCRPEVILVDFGSFYAERDRIYGEAWELFGVDSLHAYGDYDEASMFSYAAAQVTLSFSRFYLSESDKVIYHAHEWMTGLGLLFLKHQAPAIATVFTTHATTVGRAIAGNGKPLYDYFQGYSGDQMAAELGVQSKHSVEKQAALHADCFTTVSELTARECAQLITRTPVVTPNGFDDAFVPEPDTLARKRSKARKRIISAANKLMGQDFDDTVFIVATSGRCEFRNKGIDLFIDSINSLRGDSRLSGRRLLALINVPAWVDCPRADLAKRLERTGKGGDGQLEHPFLTHWLHNLNEDAISGSLRASGLAYNTFGDVSVMFVPCYLDGKDGIFNMPYYDLLAGQDLSIYPSYYEPWGYTPLESCAFSIPTITTDLAGFGLWVEHKKGLVPSIGDGVAVIHRTDSNYSEARENIKQSVITFVTATEAKRRSMGRKAQAFAKAASWDKFIMYYKRAYENALETSRKLIQG